MAVAERRDGVAAVEIENAAPRGVLEIDADARARA
jgi:hypothetical protein